MASLRRPSQLPSRTHGQPTQSNSKPPPLPENAVAKKDARKSRVGDRIKKRLSMRYVGADEFLNTTAAPPVPGTNFLENDPYQGITYDEPGDEAGSSRFNEFVSSDFQQSAFGSHGDEGINRRGAADTSRENEWDLEELVDENFDLQAFLKRTLTGADDEEVRRFKAALERSKQSNAKELQRNVFKQCVLESGPPGQN